MPILTPQEGREYLRDRLRQISHHAEQGYVREAAEKALSGFSEASVLPMLHLPVDYLHREKLTVDFNNCFFAGGFDVAA